MMTRRMRRRMRMTGKGIRKRMRPSIFSYVLVLSLSAA
jgi:hypothetical protein